MRAIKRETYARLCQLATHPKAGTVDQMLTLCAEQKIEVDEYADLAQLQLDVIDAFDRYCAAQPGDPKISHMRVCAAASAQACGFMTADDPLPGADVANMVANDVIVIFATALGKNLSWLTTPFTTKPTHDGNQTFN